MKSVFKLLFVLVLFSGCTSDGVDCDTGPVGFTFEVVDEATGENLFINGQYEENQIQIKNNEGKTVDFIFQTERNVVGVSLGWESKSDTYTVSISEEIEFNIVFTLEESNSKPCSATRLTELEIEGATFETSNTTGITTIFISSQAN